MLYIWKNEKLPVGTEYRVICDREDLFGGKIIEAFTELDLAEAPSKYPNGVDMLDGCVAIIEVSDG